MSSLNLHTLPLHGRQVIEASAGTGKTWTLAALYLRLVLAHGREGLQPLLPSQILVMTFTEAATAELRERVRDRLHQAAVWFDAKCAGVAKADAFLDTLALDVDATDWPRCAAQLHQAAHSMDDAAIFTIHGWSRRMLSSFALHSRDLFEQTHLDNPNTLLLKLASDHWRHWYYPLPQAAQQALFKQVCKSPEGLLKLLDKRWKDMDHTPPSAVDMDAPVHAVSGATPLPADTLAPFVVWQAAHDALESTAKAAWQSELAQTLLSAQEDKFIRGSGISKTHFKKWVADLQAWAEQGASIDDKTLFRFTRSNLQAKSWAQADQYPLFECIEQIALHQALQPPCKEPLLDHAAVALRALYAQAKQQQAVFDFQDLLQRLHHALHADQGAMAAAVRAQYPVALVDEFQDTDPWQYESLDRIYHPDHTDHRHALVMIGDPKQAIYGFRGADLNTYLQARQDALTLNPDAVHSLAHNHRSTAGLVRAINHVFSFGQTENPFHQAHRPAEQQVQFVQVDSASQAMPLPSLHGEAIKPLTVWHLPPPDSDQPTYPAAAHLKQMAQGFATQMVQLLHQHPTLHPGQMAVLVRGRAHAQAMQHALQQRGLSSVYLSDHANVFQSPEALDLWRVLRAISAPRQTAWLRSALACRVWGLHMAELQATLQDDTQSDALAESCQRWLQQWQSQGVLPMIHSWLHEQHIAARLLASTSGERQLTNLLHLGELLQHASQSLQGPQALLQFLADNIHSSSDNPEAQKMRLETDAACVQIVTYHKSKGLEYPLVFVPFLGSFNTGKSPSGKPPSDDDEAPDPTETSVEEDMRLLYVALTRAKRGLWLGLAPTAKSLAVSTKPIKRSAVSQLLQRQNHSDLIAQLHALWGSCPDIAVLELPPPDRQTYQAPVGKLDHQAALRPKRHSHARWWTASFSSLTRGLEAGTEREEAFSDAHTDATLLDASLTQADANPWQSFPAGARYGTLLHDLLEWQAVHGWPLVQDPPPAWQAQAWQQLLQRKADGLQLSPAEQDSLTPWLQATLRTPLSLTTGAGDMHAQALASQATATPLVLSHLQSSQLWAEMAFNLPAGQVSSGQLDAVIQQHVFPGQARPALQATVMQGMLTGFMDLVVHHDGRYWVLDYKSNKLGDYNDASLQAAVLDKRYEVQYVLYTLALHRLLKQRLRGYHYEQHMGGAVYVFLRGVSQANAGVHAMRPSFALIDQLDQLFAKVPA